MSDSKDDLLNRIADDRPPEATRKEEARRKLTRWFDGRRNVVVAKVTIWVLASMLIVGPGIYLILATKDMRLMLMGLGMLVAGFGMNGVVKLWYWMVDTKLALVKELKLVQLDQCSEPPEDMAEESLRELTTSLMPEAYGRKRKSMWEKMSRRTALRLSFWSMVVGTAVFMVCVGYLGGAAALRIVTEHDGPEVTQDDEWRFTSVGTVEARSTIEYCRNPGADGFVTLSLPFGDAKVQTIAIDGEPAPYSQLDWRRIEVELPPYGFPESPRIMVVNWSVPVASLDSTPEGLRTNLAALLPVHRYVLWTDLEPGCGYVFDGKPELDRQQQFYGQGTRPRTFYGSCGLVVPIGDAGTDSEVPSTP
ncbi:MAG: hypothetical protein GY851_11990 [bacterium]|nr:hypothetical protein [bacterium]